MKLILPSATDSGLIFNAGRSYYDELLRAGIKIYERRDVLLHTKTVLIDGVWSTIGSTNAMRVHRLGSPPGRPRVAGQTP